MTTTHPASSLHTDVTVLKQLTAIRLDVAIWTARKKLSAADFGNAGLPPEKLASLGSKRVCNPEDLRIFAALKARAVALLERTGVRFLDGWAIPEAKTYTAVQELSRIGTAFGDAKAAFLARYDETIRQWIADNPGWESLISRIHRRRGRRGNPPSRSQAISIPWVHHIYFAPALGDVFQHFRQA